MAAAEEGPTQQHGPQTERPTLYTTAFYNAYIDVRTIESVPPFSLKTPFISVHTVRAVFVVVSIISRLRVAAAASPHPPPMALPPPFARSYVGSLPRKLRGGICKASEREGEECAIDGGMDRSIA